MAKVVLSTCIKGVYVDPVATAIDHLEKKLLNWEWYRTEKTEKDADIVRHIGTLYRDGETLSRGWFYRGRSFGMPSSVPVYRFQVDVYQDHMRVNVFEF